ncbi:universal stress protein [Candidatus Bathyarchaeota archaeon]|nr:MAG: universal stress protein [Candidatus Bathyarchaeota archaeon]
MTTLTGTSVLPRKITVAVEGSPPSLKAAEYALELASLTGSAVIALHVILLPQYIDEQTKSRLREELTARGEKVLDQTNNMPRKKEVIFTRRILETNTSIALTICDFSEREGADLIILGDRTEASPVARLMLGSVAAGVANNASCPVLVVR